LQLGLQIQEQIAEGLDAAAIGEKLATSVESISHSGYHQSAARSFDEWAEIFDNQPPLKKIKTGVSFLDTPTRGGFEVGQLVLLSGDPEAGKTMLAVQMLKNITRTTPAAFFSFEFTMRKFIQTQREIEGPDYRNPHLLCIDTGYDIQDVAREIIIHHKNGVKFFVIDSQMRLENATGKNDTIERYETGKFEVLAKIAHKLEVCIILIIQNSKADTAAGIATPMGSKKGAHEASITIHLKRLKDDEQNGVKQRREIIFGKNKQTGIHFKGEINFCPIEKHFKRPYGEGTVEVTIQDENGNTTKTLDLEMPLIGGN
jgi:hypothetical protein